MVADTSGLSTEVPITHVLRPLSQTCVGRDASTSRRLCPDALVSTWNTCWFASTMTAKQASVTMKPYFDVTGGHKSDMLMNRTRARGRRHESGGFQPFWEHLHAIGCGLVPRDAHGRAAWGIARTCNSSRIRGRHGSTHVTGFHVSSVHSIVEGHVRCFLLTLQELEHGVNIAQKFYADNLSNLANWSTAAWLLQ